MKRGSNAYAISQEPVYSVYNQGCCQGPTLVAQSDVSPICDQEVAGSILTGSGTILPWSLITKYFLQSFSPFC